MFKKIAMIVMSATLMNGCINMNRFPYKADYDYSLKSVKVNNKQASDDQMMSLAFQDEWIKIYMMPDVTGVGFVIENKADNSLKLIWNNSSIIIDNQPLSVYHAGVKYADATRPMQDTLIPAGTNLKDGAYPAKYLSFGKFNVSDTGSYWKKEKMVKLYTQSTEQDYSKFVESVNASANKDLYSLLLTLENGPDRREYRFDFKVKSGAVSKSDDRDMN